jgi:tetratricopeptide (TPR) repeat protein
MRGWGRGLALALLLAAAIPSGAALADPAIEQLLLDKANYWRLKDRPDLAAEALNKLLEISPNHQDALFQYGMVSVQQNKIDDARRYLAKLQEVAPDSPHIADLQNTIRAGNIGPTDLTEARRLVQAGDLVGAVKKYQEAFKGLPPPSFAVEYYMTLAGTPQGWDEARLGMEKIAKESPNDPQIKLALAKLYTYREPTRMQGIAMLAELSKNPVVAANAIESWRQALTWLGGSPQARTALQQYLAQNPDDNDIRQLLDDLNRQPMIGGPGSGAPGYADLKLGNLAAAERQFASDLKANPKDVQALIGMGFVRMRQQRFAEARDYFGRAIQAAPDQKPDIEPAYQTAAFWAQVDAAKHMAAAGNNAGARVLLTQLLSHGHADNWGAELVLGDIDLRMNDGPGAEAAFRRALNARPGNLDALVGLMNALRAQNKTAELAALNARLSPAERAQIEKRAAAGGGGAGEALRNEAKAALANGDTKTADAKFKAALAADPRNVWIRLDYARFLAGQNDLQQAFAMVDPAASGNTPLSLYVSAMFDTQQDQWGRALDKIDRIPPNQRSDDIRNFRERIYVHGSVDKAKQLYAAGDVTGARNILVSVYEDPNVKTDEKREIPHVLYHDMHDSKTALRITHDVYTRGGPGSVKAAADYAMMLMMIGHHDDEAAAIIDQVEASGRITDDNREEFDQVRAFIASKKADKLRLTGNYADAYDQIAQLLANHPNDVGLLMAEGRLYASAGRYHQALEFFDKAYQADPTNIDVIRAAAGGALMAHDLNQAQAYLDKGMEADPQNPWLFYLKAQIERAKGNNAAAFRALETARSLDQKQNPGTPGATPANTPPPNPFRRSQLLPPHLRSTMVVAALSDKGAPAVQLREDPR